MTEQKRERGAGRVFLRGNTIWIQYNRHGEQLRESTGIALGATDEDRKAELKKAEKILRKRLGEVEAGIVRDSRSLRYEDIRDSYLEDCETNESKSLRHDEDGKIYLESVRRLDAFFEGFRAVEIDVDQIRKFQRHSREQALANATINRSVASLRRMFHLAQREEKIRNLPYFPMLKESKPRRGTLHHAQFPALLAALPDYLRPVVTIGFRTGMRLGEILKLTWDDVRWMDKAIFIADPKNDEPREIPFTDELETVLREQFARRQPGCDRVCFRLDRKGHAQPIGNFRKAWYRACVKTGLGKWEPELDGEGKPIFEPKRYAKSKPKQKMTYNGLIFHDLRRSFITDAEHSGAPRHEVMKVSGHKTESVYKRYAIDKREQRRAVLAHIDAYRSRKVQGQNGDNSEVDPTESPVIN